VIYFIDDAGHGVLVRWDEQTSEVLDRAMGRWRTSRLASEVEHGERVEFTQISAEEAARVAASFGASL
jgi:hypothetical protein